MGGLGGVWEASKMGCPSGIHGLHPPPLALLGAPSQ